MGKDAVMQVVVPAAGLGSRFLPLSKAVPKELLPLVGRPAIEWVLREAGAAGIGQALLITRQGKSMIEDYFEGLAQFGDAGESGGAGGSGGAGLLGRLPRLLSVRQAEPKGLGDAVLQACSWACHGPFAVLLPDDIFTPEAQLMRQLIAVQARLGGSVVALIEVSEQQAGAYGSARVSPVQLPASDPLSGPDAEGDLAGAQVFALHDVIEKPGPSEVRSSYAMVGRYVLDPAVFGVLEQTAPGFGGEVQLTDALATLAQMPAAQGGGLWGVLCQGQRFDTGTPTGYLHAAVALALADPKVGPELSAWVRGYLAGGGAA